MENRARAAVALGFDPAAMVCGEQVHGGVAAVVGKADAGRGARRYEEAIPGADALVTNTPNLLLTLCYADCVPIFLVDPRQRAVAVIHAGWKGMAADVIENTVTTLQKDFGSDPADLIAAVGPCIGPCCFEVGPEVAARFPDDTECNASREQRPHVDLPGAARRLRAAGIAGANITIAGECTACLPGLYFSHRRDRGATGRMGALIGIAQGP